MYNLVKLPAIHLWAFSKHSYHLLNLKNLHTLYHQFFLIKIVGVILNSNKIKTNAFYEVASKYGQKEADELVNHHINNGGVSRYKKFEYFAETILSDKTIKQTINELCEDFSDVVLRDLNNSEVNTEIFKLKETYPLRRKQTDSLSEVMPHPTICCMDTTLFHRVEEVCGRLLQLRDSL